MIKAIHENDAKKFEEKVNKLLDDGYRVTSSYCTYVGEVGNSVYDCESWMAILSKKQIDENKSSRTLTPDTIRSSISDIMRTDTLGRI